MECLKDILCNKRTIIGIRGFDNCDKPESDLFINDIPGITLKSAAAIASEEQKSGYDLLKSITGRAVQLVFEEFYAQATSKFQFNQVAETRELHNWDGSTLAPTAQDRGLVVKRWRSELAQLVVEDLFVKTKQSGDYEIRIIDGPNTHKVPVTLIADQEVRVRVDYVAKYEEIKILLLNTGLNVYSGPLNRSSFGCQTCQGNWNGSGLYVAGWNGSAEDANYYGIGLLASVRCFEENILCQLLKRMSFLFWYKAGIMYYEELLASNRLNPITIYTKDKAQENIDNLTLKYEKAFANFIPTIQNFIISTKGECFSCNPSIKSYGKLTV